MRKTKYTTINDQHEHATQPKSKKVSPTLLRRSAPIPPLVVVVLPEETTPRHPRLQFLDVSRKHDFGVLDPQRLCSRGRRRVVVVKHTDAPDRILPYAAGAARGGTRSRAGDSDPRRREDGGRGGGACARGDGSGTRGVARRKASADSVGGVTGAAVGICGDAGSSFLVVDKVDDEEREEQEEREEEEVDKDEVELEPARGAEKGDGAGTDKDKVELGPARGAEKGDGAGTGTTGTGAAAVVDWATAGVTAPDQLFPVAEGAGAGVAKVVGLHARKPAVKHWISLPLVCAEMKDIRIGIGSRDEAFEHAIIKRDNERQRRAKNAIEDGNEKGMSWLALLLP
ncbi:hypothetical protein DFH06DRAFT_1120625 [Mycena polygramma]|nr:hypothetical protein DFH06DRAFT_1120625 [Mycena polygramma]